MKIIYRLPKYFALFILVAIVFAVHVSIKANKTTDLAFMIKYVDAMETMNGIILGLDLYTFLALVGLIIGVAIGVLRRNSAGLNLRQSILIQLLFMLQVFIGVKIAYGLEKVIASMEIDVFSISGQSLYGGVFTSLLFVPVLAYYFGIDSKKIFDYVTPLWLCEFIFGKIGCFTCGCCGARACSILNVSVILPIQLFEVFCLLIILQIVFNIEKKRVQNEICKVKEGASFFIAICLYGVCRLLTEFIKDTPMLFWHITINQVFAIVSIIIAIIVLRRWEVIPNK